MSTHYDWSKFVLKINIKASVDAVYHAWTRPDELEKWFLRRAVFHDAHKKQLEYNAPYHPDHVYEWYWHGHDDKVVEKGKVILANGIDKLQFSFTAGALVTVDIGEMMGETIVMLTQEKIPTDEHGRIHYHMDCKTGWTFYLANLKSYLEGGVDLRNKNLSFTQMINS